ncbi:MAG: glycosyltransferase [Oscillochloris sp.]|nr:glycosyltransferase [Oscillochloris sp.]
MHNLLSHLVITAKYAGQPFDLVHVDQLRMAPYAEPLPIPRLLDTHDVHYRTYEARVSQQYGVQRWWTHRESAMLRRYEGRICASFEAVTTISDEDRQALLDVMPYPHACELTTIPIAVDGESLTPIPRDPASQTIVSIVAPSWVPNGSGISWFAHEVYPLVCRAAPNSQLLICGAQSIPAGYAERGLAQQHPHIQYVDQADLAEQSTRAACLIAPLQHSGMRIMIVEALARAIPVVATHAAIAGLNLRAGEHLLVADTPSDFADAVVMLLREPDLGQRIAAAGRQVVLEHYHWRVAYRVFDAVYERMVAAVVDQSRMSTLSATKGSGRDFSLRSK